MENPVQALDEAVLSRLRHAIAAEAGGEEEQLKGVLRMLGDPRRESDPLIRQGTGRPSAKALRLVLAKRSEGA